MDPQPCGRVTAIEDGDFKLFESRAIARYIATKYANRGPDLFCTTRKSEHWLEVEVHNFNDLVFNIIFNLYILPKKNRGMREETGRSAGHLRGTFGCKQVPGRRVVHHPDRSHLPGTNFLITEVGRGYLVRERKNVNRWWEEITGRRAWKKVLNEAIIYWLSE